MSIHNKVRVLMLGKENSIVISEVMIDEAKKKIYLASSDEYCGLLVRYTNTELAEQLRIAKVISALSGHNPKYVLCKIDTEDIGFFIKDCNKILESNLSTKIENVVGLCENLIKEFIMIHNEGFSFSEVGISSFAYNMTTNEIGIIAPEKIGSYGEKIENIGSWITGCMAPEIITDNHIPDIYSDRYSLAIILFNLLFGTDPMIGKKVKAEMEEMPGRIFKRWWGEDRSFILGEDESNVSTNKEVILKWNAANGEIRDEFNQNFSITTQREERTSEDKWLALIANKKLDLREPEKLIYHLIFIVANPVSMHGVKMDVLNNSIEELIPEICDIAEFNDDVDIYLSIMTVADTANWQMINVRVDNKFKFEYLKIDTCEEINVAGAMELLRKDFLIPNRSCLGMLRPTIIWFIDGQVTGNYKYQLGLNSLFNLYKNINVYGIKIGECADDVFLNEICNKVINIYTPESLIKFISFTELNKLENDVIKIIDDFSQDEKTIYLMKELGETGRAKEYYCIYDNEDAIYREFYNPIIPMEELYVETVSKIKSGKLPGEWPIAISKMSEGKFGYVYRKCQISNVKSLFTSLQARILACKNIVKIYGIIHDRGFCFQHARGTENFNIDYQTGNVELICVDEILTLGKFNRILRNSFETAPEVLLNNIPSSIESDRYSLAVFLFEILFDGHPLMGKKTIDFPSCEIQKLWLVDKPVYVWDWRNDSNRPLYFQNNRLIAPPYIMNAFSYAFSEDVVKLKNHKKRITEREWYSLFKQWWDEMKQ